MAKPIILLHNSKRVFPVIGSEVHVRGVREHAEVQPDPQEPAGGAEVRVDFINIIYHYLLNISK